MTITAKTTEIDGFLFALLGAPLVTAVVLGIPLLIIFPVGLVILFAPFFGYVPFVLLGGPLLWLSLKVCGNNPFTHIAAALIAVGLIGPLAELGLPFNQSPDLASFGFFMGPLWALAFGWLYGKLANPPMLDTLSPTQPEDS